MKRTHLIAILTGSLLFGAGDYAQAAGRPAPHPAPAFHPAPAPRPAPAFHPAPVHVQRPAPAFHPQAVVRAPHPVQAARPVVNHLPAVTARAAIHAPVAPAVRKLAAPVAATRGLAVNPNVNRPNLATARGALAARAQQTGWARSNVAQATHRTLLSLLKGNKLAAQTALKHIPATGRHPGVAVAARGRIFPGGYAYGTGYGYGSNGGYGYGYGSPYVYGSDGGYGYGDGTPYGFDYFDPSTFGLLNPDLDPGLPADAFSAPTPGLPDDAQPAAAELGVRIIKVFPDWPAAQNDLRVGDIIVSVNGQRVQTADQLTAAIAGVNGPVELVFFNGETQQLEKMPITPLRGKLGIDTEPAYIPN
jgi:membrane-associated protease RseP (regulator of RpoE activity)